MCCSPRFGRYTAVLLAFAEGGALSTLPSMEDVIDGAFEVLLFLKPVIFNMLPRKLKRFFLSDDTERIEGDCGGLVPASDR